MRFVCVLPVLAFAACGDPTDPPPHWTPAAADLRFKGVGTTTTALPSLLSGLTDHIQIHHNRRGTPLEISPCAPPSPGGINCYWLFAAFDVADVNTIYYGIGSLPKLETDLGALQRWQFASPITAEDINSVVTSLMIDEPSSAYATSGIQTSEMRDFDLTWASVAPNALQAATSQAGANGRVITAIAVNAGNVVYLSYGWERDRSTAYEVRVANANFDTVAREAASLARAGYVITALGGTADALVLVGTRMRGAVTPRPVEIATDSVPTQPYESPAVKLARDSYAIVGAVLGSHTGDARIFNIYLGEK